MLIIGSGFYTSYQEIAIPGYASERLPSPGL